ncbi:hypothetical protein ACO9S2_09060 [Nitrospira sp. NS4]|uniref:hypothetical protein n=1 Tax=Nitrospira sp. NS4 TaxID=3414498 RepID=UPI003C2FCF30
MTVNSWRDVIVTVFFMLSASVAFSPDLSLADDAQTEPKSIRKTCGKCPEGYAMTGVTEAPSICKDGDPILVQCVPLGANLLPVCGSCPEGYREIGSSSVPARCGNQDGGRLSQCQLERMESNFPDSTTGGKICPPDCGSTATPGRGALPPPPNYQYIPPSEKK